MGTTTAEFKKELMKEIDKLSVEKIEEVLNFVCYIRAKDVIDPTQAYFWTDRWQEMEKEADKDRKKGRIVGDGKVKDLLKKLKK